MGADVKKLVVFSVRKHEKTGAVVWTKAGVATTNRDGTISIDLDVLPIDGKLHARPEDTVAKTDWAAMPEHMLKKQRQQFEQIFNEASTCVCEPRCKTIDEHICKLSQTLNVHKADCAHCTAKEKARG